MIRTAEVFEDDYPEDEVGMNNTVTIYVEEEDVSEKKKVWIYLPLFLCHRLRIMLVHSDTNDLDICMLKISPTEHSRYYCRSKMM